jgi:Tol biopolymer transport system component
MRNQILLALSLSLFALSSCALYPRVQPTPTPPLGFLNVDSFLDGQRLRPPSLSADGKLLAAFASVDPRDPFRALYVIDLETRQVLFTSDKKGRITLPAISPDGRLVAIDQYLGSGSQVFVANLTTNQTSYLADGSSPAWSADGQQLAYIYDPSSPGDPDRRMQLRVYDFATGTDTVILELARVWGDIVYLTWFPDGTGLAFFAALDIQLDSQGMRIPGTDYAAFYTIGVDGDNLREVETIPYGRRNFNFSPDSRKILYTPEIGSFLQVSDMNGHCHRVQTPLDEFYSATLSADGRTIVFETYYGLLVADTALVLGDDFWEVGEPCENS